jgi:hypothetical protein
VSASASAARTVPLAIGLSTAASGASLLVAPRLALRLMGAGTTSPAPFLFRVVGMFMVVTGGNLADASRDGAPDAVALRWGLVQKVGASTAMTVGVLTGAYRRRALGVALFDGACAAALAALALRPPDSP